MLYCQPENQQSVEKLILHIQHCLFSGSVSFARKIRQRNYNHQRGKSQTNTMYRKQTLKPSFLLFCIFARSEVSKIKVTALWLFIKSETHLSGSSFLFFDDAIIKLYKLCYWVILTTNSWTVKYFSISDDDHMLHISYLTEFLSSKFLRQ